jgi:hypothetical protein
MISSHNGFNNESNMDSANVSRLMDMSNNSALNDSVLSGHREQQTEVGQPSYTPVRRNPGVAYQRTKP